jgi:hypothetical protein
MSDTLSDGPASSGSEPPQRATARPLVTPWP